MQFGQIFTSLKICFKWIPRLTFPGILKPAAYQGKESTIDVCILKPKANCLAIKGLYPNSRACNLTLNRISNIL